MWKSLKSNYLSLPIPYTLNESVAFIIDNQLTKKQYTSIRIGSKAKNCNIYPSYNKELNAKNCYPYNISITEDSV